MARIRTIKPEFPRSEGMGNVSRDARLCFVLMWTLADDAGRLRGASRLLASLLFPYDDDALELLPTWLAELEAEECIQLYKVDGSTYIQITKWLSHQKIDKPSQSKIPPFDEQCRILANPREPSSLDQGSRTEEKDRDRDVAQSARREQVAAVFDHWRKVMGHLKAKLDDKREKLIEARMKAGYSADDLKAAIDGCSKTPFNMGHNEQGTRYDGLELILRDGAHVDRFIATNSNPPRPMGKQGMIEANNRRAGDEFLNGPDWFGGDTIDAEPNHA